MTFISPTRVEEGVFADGGVKKSKEDEWPRYVGTHSELEKLREGVLYDCQDLLMNMGFEFRDQEFAVFREANSTLYVKLSANNLELLNGVISTGHPVPPQMIRVDFWEVEGDEKSGNDYWLVKDAKVSRKIGQFVVPGNSSTVRLGRDLAVELEAQIAAYDEVIEVGATLSERRGKLSKASFKTGMTLLAGKAFLIQESRVGDKRKAWVVRADVVNVDRETLGR